MLYDPDDFVVPLHKFPKSVQKIKWQKITNENSLNITWLLHEMYGYLKLEGKLKFPKKLKISLNWNGIHSFIHFILIRPANFPQPEVRLLDDKTTLIFMTTLQYHPGMGTKFFRKNKPQFVPDSLSPGYVMFFESDFENYLIEMRGGNDNLLELRDFMLDDSYD
ncbi:MAG: hypothetical protein ACW99A_03550 [Candidatus Kariarchaeaceae archaeon]|jgi:hypothetical protein